MEQVIQNYNNIFYKCICNYDLSDNNLLRKMIHSYEVARNCFSIAARKGMNVEERNFCYLMGLFHDIGRFKQWEIYHTYDDVKSEDHGELSCSILENLDCSSLFGIDVNQNRLLKEAIRFHTKPYLGNDEKIREYNDILKNADAFSNVISTASGMQQMTVNEDGGPSEIVAERFRNKELLVGISPKTKIDRCLMLTACCYYVKDSYLREEILKNRYMDMIFETFSKYLNELDKATYKEMIETLKNNF